MLHTRLILLGEKFLATAINDRLIAMSEGFVKVRCIESALILGWTIQEGIGHSTLADFAKSIEDKIIWTRAKRLLRPEIGSADLTIVQPFQMLLEIKSRPDHGTKSQAQFAEMDYDVERVSKNPLCALFFIFEEKSYRSFSLEKEDNRGRRALTAEWFNGCFPKLQQIREDRWLTIDANRDGRVIRLSFRRTRFNPSGSIILVLGSQVV